MTMQHQFKGSSLSWVKTELDALLESAREGLGYYIEDDKDPAELERVIAALQKVDGTLKMVELYGAAILTREMEVLVQTLRHGEVEEPDNALEALFRAILQLPDYLEHIQAGNRDVPIILLPLLNDIRAARGAELLSEKVLFFPELEVASIPRGEVVQQTDQSQHVVAKKLRHVYQLGLLGWFRKNDPKGSLKKLYQVTNYLYRAADNESSRRLWWISSALIEALSLNGLGLSTDTNSLLGQIDRQIKQWDDLERLDFYAQIPEELIKNLLFCLASAEDEGERVGEVKNAYHLNELIPKGKDLDEIRERVSRPNQEVLRTVAAAVNDDLADVKDKIELFMQDQERDSSGLKSVNEKLHAIANTLGMLDLEEAKETVAKQAVNIDRIFQGLDEVDDEAILGVAGVMLEVEASIDRLVDSRSNFVEVDSTETISAEHRKLRETVVVESLQELAKAKEVIANYISSPQENKLLEKVLTHFCSLRGALSLGGIEEVITLLDSISSYIESLIKSEKTTPPDATELETFADAFICVEFYLESLRADRGAAVHILKSGQASVTKLGHPVDEPTSEIISLLEIEDDTQNPGLQEALNEGNESTMLFDPSSRGDACSESTQILQFPKEGEDTSGDHSADVALANYTDDLEIDPNKENDEPTIFFKSEQDNNSTHDSKPNEGESTVLFDGKISKKEDRLSTDNDESAVLLEPSPENIETVDSGSDVDAPTMFFNINEIEQLGADAEKTEIVSSDGKSSVHVSSDMLDSTQAINSEESSNTNFGEKELFNEDVDDEIIEIFIEEAEEETSSIQESLKKLKISTEYDQALMTVRRSFHTLKGSGRLVGAKRIGEFAWTFENMLNRVMEKMIEPDEQMFGLLEQAGDNALPGLISEIKGLGVPEVDIEKLMIQAEALSTIDMASDKNTH